MATKVLVGMVYVGLLLRSTVGLTCYECYSAREPQLCTYHRECGQNEKCGIHKTQNLLGATVYHLECLPDTICEGSEAPPTFIGRRRRDTYKEVTCCDTDLCNHGINTVATTEILPIASTTVTGCHDNNSCLALKALGLQVCAYHDIATRLCPAMCNRCNDVISGVTGSSSVTSGLELTSPNGCHDTSTECVYLKDTLHICDHYDVIVHFGCLKTCSLCDVTSPTGTYSTDSVYTSDSPTSGVGKPEKSTPKTTIPVTSGNFTPKTTIPVTSDNFNPKTTIPVTSENVTPKSTIPVTVIPVNSTAERITSQHLRSQESTSGTDAVKRSTPLIPMPDNMTPSSDREEFVFLYATNKVPSDSHLDLLLASNVTGSLTLRGLGGHVCLNYTYTPGSTTIEVPQSLQLSKQTIENKGIQVVTSNDVTLHAMYHDPSTTDGFFLLPVRDLSNKYVVPSFDKNGIFKTFIGVTAVTDNTTIQIKIHTNQDYFFGGHAYKDGETLPVHLNKLEAFELTHTGDVTGTLITSNHPIAVQSGSQCSSVPVDTGTCNHLQEMVPSVSQLGSTYIVPPLVSTQSYFVRVIAAYPMTVANVQNGDFSGFILPEVGNFSSIQVKSPALVFVNSSQPVLVAHYAEGLDQGEPAMTIIPPIKLFRTEYDVSISDRAGYENYLSIIIPTDHISDVRINGVTLTWYRVHIINGTHDILSHAYSSVNVKVVPGMYHVNCEPSEAEFGLLVYGFSDENAYEYPAAV